MKKQYLLGMAVALASAAQAQNAALPDSTVTYWRGEPSEKSVYLYANEQGDLAEQTDYRWNENTQAWEPNSKGEYQYDEAGNLVLTKGYDWADGQWVSRRWSSSTFDAQGNETEEKHHIWRDGAWFLLQHTLKQYDDQARLTRQDTYDYDYDDEHEHCVDLYTYDESGQHITSITSDTTWMRDTTLIISDRMDKTLYEGGRIVRTDRYAYYGMPNEYLSSIDSTVYNERGQCLIDIQQNFDEAGNLRYTSLLENRYDENLKSNRNVYQAVGSKGADEADFSRNETRAEVTYGNPEILRWMEHSALTGEEWIEGSTVMTYYPKSGTTANEPLAAQTLRIQTDDGTIRLTLDQTTDIYIFTLSGKCYYRAKKQGVVTIQNLPKGLYIVRAGNETKKVVVP